MPVVVKYTKEEPNPAKNDQAVDVAEDHNCSQETVDHQEDLADVEAESLVSDVVQDDVGERGGVRNLFMSQGQAGRGGEES